MADDFNPLDIDPGDYADLGNLLLRSIRENAMDTDNMLPAKIVSYDRVKNTATVQPMIRYVLTDTSGFSRAQIAEVPVFAMGAGNYVINFPIKEGDTGWLIANDRDISGYMETLAESNPTTYRLHSLNDAVFFPDVIRNFDATGEDNNLVIQSMDGKIRISLGEEQLKLTHPTKIFLDAPMVEFQKDSHGPGSQTWDTESTVAGIKFTTHKHAGTGTLRAGTTPVSGDTDVPHN